MPSNPRRPHRLIPIRRAAGWAIFLVALSACRKEPTPAPAPLAPFEVEGHVLVPDEADSSGTQVFIPGSSLLSITDEEGYFILSGIPAGQRAVVAQRPGFATARLAEFDVPEGQPGKRWVLSEITLQPLGEEAEAAKTGNGAATRARRARGEILGSILVSEKLASRKPDLSAARIELEGTSDRTFPGGDGKFRLSGLQPGKYLLRARIPGFADITREVEIPQTDQPVELTLTLEPAEAGQEGAPAGDREVIGAVELFTAEGDPVSDLTGVIVTVLEAPEIPVTLTEFGSFRIAGLQRRVYNIRASWQGHDDVDEAVVDLREQPSAEIVLRLLGDPAPAAAPGGLRGRVIKNKTGVSDMSGAQIALAGTASIAVSDSSGAWTLPNVPPGTYDLIAQAEGFENATLTSVEAASGETREVEDIILEPKLDYPVVVDANPASGARDVVVRRAMPFVIRFSKKMRADAVKAAVTLEPAVETRLFMGREHPLADDDVLVVEIDGTSQDLPPKFNTQYTITVGTGAADLEGLSLREPFRLRFRTGQASVTDTLPPQNDTEAVLNPALAVQVFFNARINPQSVEPRDFRIRPSIGVIPTVNVIDDPLTGWSVIHISAVWAPDTRYEVTLPRRIKTATGQSFSNLPYTLKFKTARPSPLPPGIFELPR